VDRTFAIGRTLAAGIATRQDIVLVLIDARRRRRYLPLLFLRRHPGENLATIPFTAGDHAAVRLDDQPPGPQTGRLSPSLDFVGRSSRPVDLLVAVGIADGFDMEPAKAVA
jgi:hypothetical protein